MSNITKGENAKRGYWELSGLSPYIGIRTCSVCKAEYDINKRFNECPNCGTKMLREYEETMSETTREFAGCGNGFCENCDFYPQCRFAPNLDRLSENRKEYKQ